MNPFAKSPTRSQISLLGRLAARPALITFVVCLVLGLIVVAWRARARSAFARTLVASPLLQEPRATLARQLDQAVAAVEALGALARQSSGLGDFQRVAAALSAAHPGVATLECQPGGVVTDIFPRTGYERILAARFDVLKDPAYGPGAALARNRRALTVTGPLRLYRGELGLIVRLPLFQRGRDGREFFWGFVAASVRLGDALNRARVDDLWRQGYACAFFGPGFILPISGDWPSLDGAARQVLRPQNPEFGLALRPLAGWVNKTKAALEALAVLLASGLLCLLVNLLESRNALEATLADSSRRLIRETADRNQAQEDARRARDAAAAALADLKQCQTAAQQAQAKTAEAQTRLEASDRNAAETAKTLQARLKQAERNAADLQAKFDAAAHTAEEAAQAREAELTKTRAALAQAQQSLGELQARADAAARAAQAEATAARTRAQQEAAASAAKLAQLEQTNQDLQARLAAAERVQAVPAPEGGELKSEVPTPAPHAEPSPQPEMEDRPSAVGHRPSDASPAEPSDLKTEIPPAPEAHLPSAADHLASEIQTPAPEPTTPPPLELSNLRPESPAPLPDLESNLQPEVQDRQSEVEARESSASPAKRKKPRRADQMDFFGGPTPTDQAADDSATGTGVSPVSLGQDAQATAHGTGVVPPPGATSRSERTGFSEVPPAGTEVSPGVGQGEPASTGHSSFVPALRDRWPPSSETPPEEPPPLPTPLPELPAIEGLAVATGLARAEGDHKAYFQALRQYCERQAGAPEGIRDALLQGEAAEAQRLVQALQAEAEAIGAMSVLQAAATLTRALHERPDPAEVESIWAELEEAQDGLLAALKPVLHPKEDKPARPRRLPTPPRVNPAQLREAVSAMVPLLADADPGARDCLRDNRATFRSAFTPEAFLEFEHSVKRRDFSGALEQLRKAARKHGIVA
jgi:hypothetical protein